MLGEEKIESSGNNLLAFAGGFIGAMTHYIASIRILLTLNFHELFDFTIHSIIGGIIMLAIKIANDGLMYLIKKYINKQNKNKNTEDKK